MTDLLARLRIEANASNTPAVANQVAKAIDGVGDAARRANANLNSTEAAANRAAAGLDRTGDQAQRLDTRLRGTASGAAMLGGALGAVGVAAFVNDASRAAFAASGLELGLGAVTGGAANASAELAFVRQEADRLGLVVQATSKDFLDLAASTNGTAIAGEATRQIWLATAEAGMALGRSSDQIGRGLTALSQIAGKGVVSMEEVRQQLAEAIPGAAIIGARALNLTSAEFNALVESGELTAERFLPAFAAQLREEFGPSIEAYLNSPLGRARQELGRTQTSLNDLRAAGGEGFLEGVTSGLGRLNDQLGDGATADRAREVGEALGEGAAVAADALVYVIDHLDELTVAAQALGGVALARFLLSTATAAREAAAAYIAKGVAARAASANASAGLAAETVAAGSLSGQIRAAAAAEVQKSQATLAAANAARASALAHYAEAEAAVAAGGSATVMAQRQIIAANALNTLRAASAQAAAAQAELAAAQNLSAIASTRMGAAAIAARGGASALLGVVGGPWGAAFLAAGAAVYYTVSAVQAQEEAFTSVNRAVAETAAEYEAARQAQAALGSESQGVVTAQDAAAVAAASLTGEVSKLADEHYRAAAAAKAHALEELRLQALTAATNAQDAVRNFNTVRQTERGRAYGAQAAGGRGAGPADVANIYADADARALQSDEYQTLLTAADNARTAAENVRTYAARSLDDLVVRPPANTATGGGGGGSTGRDRAADLAEDLRLEEAALRSHAEAALRGEAALDAWRVAQAGADAVARAGTESVRAQAEAVERLAIADERIEAASNLTRSAEAETAALQRRATAALGGRAALEALRVSEAELAPLLAARVTALDQLNPLERQAVEAAIAAAGARERQAIATEQADAAGASIEDLEREIAAEGRRQAALGRGVEAEVAYARAEFVRQEVERAGLELTDAAAAGIIAKAEALFRLQAVSDGAQAVADGERELRLARMTNRERQLAIAAETILAELAATQLGLSEEQRAAMADRRARAELEAQETAAAIGRITTSLRDGFIAEGRLGMDEVADYAEQQLRAALYDAFLAEPIRILVEASVDVINDLTRQIFSSASAEAFGSDLFGGKAAEGFASKLFKAGSIGGTVVNVLASAGIGGAIGSSLGLGSGNGLIDGAAAIGGSALGGLAGGALSSYAAASSLATLAGASAAPLAGIAGMLGPIMGPLGALAGVALASLMKDEKRPYTRADIVAQGGAFTVAGTQAVDGGSAQVADQLGKAITESLNAASKLFGLDMAKLEGLYTTAGYVAGGNFKALGGEGYFGGDIRGAIDFFNQAGSDKKGNTLGAGVSFSQVGDAEALAEQVVRETILRAIAAGASDLTEAEASLVQASASLEEAISLIQTSRGFGDRLDALLQSLLDPAAFERQKALNAVEATYEALRAEAQTLIDAGLLSADALAQVARIRELQLEEATGGLGRKIDDMLLELVDPAAFERQKALDAVEETYEALLGEAETLIAAGLMTGDVLARIEQLRELQRAAALKALEGGEETTLVNPFAAVRDKLAGWLDGLRVSDLAPGDARTQRNEALAQYQRVLAAAQGADPAALADLTGYADRLLRADRGATGSASARQALFDQVTAEVQALVGRGTAEEVLTAGAITNPIVGALTGLPAEITGPIVESILSGKANDNSQPLVLPTSVGPTAELVVPLLTELNTATAGGIVATEAGLSRLAAILDLRLGRLENALVLTIDGLTDATEAALDDGRAGSAEQIGAIRDLVTEVRLGGLAAKAAA